MRVLQINTVSGYGSTGRICSDLALVLKKNGHECFIAYGQGKSNDESTLKIGSKIENHFHNIFSRLSGKQAYFSTNGTNQLITYIQKIKPNLIHLHNLHGNYLNIEILFKFLSKAEIPVVWTLHDCWAFTGKCTHYTEMGCYKWQTECHHCPQVKKYPPSLLFDQSGKMFWDKKKWFTSVKNMTLVPVSNWLASEVKNSFLQNIPVVPIYNWIDHSIFKPINENLKVKYGIDERKFVILGVSAGWKKNNNKLNDFIHLANLISNDMQIILVGKARAGIIPKEILHIPYVHGTDILAEIYSMADAYVHVSTEDTFGKVIAEAMSCGTPAIVYNSTACPELIGEGCGFVVEKRNVSEINNALQKIKINGKQFYSEHCIQNVKANFDFYANTSKTIELYKIVMSK